MSSIGRKLDQLLRSLQAKGLDPANNLRPGASDLILNAHAKCSAMPLPRGLEELYKWRNGSVDPNADVEELLMFRDMAFLSLEDGLEARRQVNSFLQAFSTNGAGPIAKDEFFPIAAMEGQYYVLALGNHEYRNLAEHPVVYIGEGIEPHFLSIETMIETCIAWVMDPSYTAETLQPDDELDAWQRLNPGVLEEGGRLLSLAGEETQRAPDIHDLFEAVSRSDEGLARLLLESGVRITDTDPFGRTVMHDAIRMGMRAAQLALQLGGEINAECSKGWTPLFHLRKYEDPNDENLEVHSWAISVGAIAKPDRLGEAWR